MTDQNTESGGDRTHDEGPTAGHTQKEFIGRTHDRRYTQLDSIRANFKEIDEEVKVNSDAPIAKMFRHVRGTGRFVKSVIQIMVGSNYRDVVRTAEELKNKFRRIRPQEALQLDTLDAEIKEVRAKLNMLQAEREGLVRIAFQKGHTVYLNEVQAVAEANLAARKTPYQERIREENNENTGMA